MYDDVHVEKYQRSIYLGKYLRIHAIFFSFNALESHVLFGQWWVGKNDEVQFLPPLNPAAATDLWLVFFGLLLFEDISYFIFIFLSSFDPIYTHFRIVHISFYSKDLIRLKWLARWIVYICYRHSIKSLHLQPSSSYSDQHIWTIIMVTTLPQVLLALIPVALAFPAPHPVAQPVPHPMITPRASLTDRTPSRVEERGVISSVESSIKGLESYLTSVIGTYPSYIASGVPNFFQDFPTGSAVQSSLGIGDSDLAATPTQVLNIP